MRGLGVGMTRRSLSGVSGKDIACRNARDGVNDPEGERWKQREERSSEMDAIHLSRCVPTRKVRGSEKPRDPPNKRWGLLQDLCRLMRVLCCYAAWLCFV